MSKSTWSLLGVDPVVNAAGKMTYLGSSSLRPAVTDAMVEAGGRYVDMADLKTAVGVYLANRVGAPAACVTSCAAAGIAQATAGTVTGTDRALIESVPDVGWSPDVLVQKGHAVHFGAPLSQMIRMTGATVREIGTVSRTNEYHLTAALTDSVTAIVYVVSHHAAGTDQLDLQTVVALAADTGVPVIVDAAAESDLARYLTDGADLVIYSGHKAIGGPISGLVLGRRDLVAACAAQEFGFGRAMKVGKETLLGLTVAVDEYLDGRASRTPEQLHNIVSQIESGLDGRIPAVLETVRDATRPIRRLRISPTHEASITAYELIRKLEAHEPSVRTRNHRAADGTIEIDPRELDKDDISVLIDAVCSAFDERGDSDVRR